MLSLDQLLRKLSYYLPKQLFANTICSIEKPDTPLFKFIDFYGFELFKKNDKIFIFGVHEDQDQKEMYILHRKGDVLIEEEKLIIPRPSKSSDSFYVIDINPWDNELLIHENHDMPFKPIWYVYNYRTNEMKKIGKVPLFGGWALYLQSNIIKKAKDRLKNNKKP